MMISGGFARAMSTNHDRYALIMATGAGLGLLASAALSLSIWLKFNAVRPAGMNK